MNDIDYMRRAIELAQRGVGFTNPNPMVGAVIVKDGRIIGEGYHRKCGELHAERNAFAALTESAKGATIYVTLEPCCHYGKTPPCTEAIIENEISRVVIGSRDPNPLVSGKGAKMLRDHGIEVLEDFLREECDEINPVFFHYITTNRPYVVMKYAMTADGKISTHSGKSQWITGEKSRSHVHALRGRYSAIMAGIGTVLADDPMLNCRVEGMHQPLRVIVDSNLRIPLDCQIVQSADRYPTVVATIDNEINHQNSKTLIDKNIQVVFLPQKDGSVEITALFDWLAANKYDSVLVEGGGGLNESVMKSGYVRRVYSYIGNKIFGGTNAKTPVEGIGVSEVDEALRLKLKDIDRFEDDALLVYDVDY